MLSALCRARRQLRQVVQQATCVDSSPALVRVLIQSMAKGCAADREVTCQHCWYQTCNKVLIQVAQQQGPQHAHVNIASDQAESQLAAP